MPNEQIPYTDELETTIFERTVRGESLRVICADPGMPDSATVRGWIDRYPKFRELYESAREFYADDLIIEILRIVDDRSVSLADSRLRVDVRWWLMARIAPSKYGTER